MDQIEAPFLGDLNDAELFAMGTPARKPGLLDHVKTVVSIVVFQRPSSDRILSPKSRITEEEFKLHLED